MDKQAQELNQILQSQSPTVYNLLSKKGKEIYFPKAGILSQSADAQTKKINATIGISLEDNGEPMCLKAISDTINLAKKEVFPYSPSFGKPQIRETWKKQIYKKNPSLEGIEISLPVVTNALTHGLSMIGYLFINEGDTIIMPKFYWENYDLVFKNAYGAKFELFDTFHDGGFNLSGLKNILRKTNGKTMIILNFPNNPTGYSLTKTESMELKKIIQEHAEKNNETIIICDDAYFGLVYEEDVFKESIFTLFSDMSEKVLAIKVDGPTKEDYVWGFRVGFITYAIKNGTKEVYASLEQKTAGAIRGNISMAPNLSQSLILKAMTSQDYEAEKKEKFEKLKERYLEVKKVLSDNKEYAEEFEALPYNSGYFMCIELKNKDAETVRQTLLKKYDTGIIAQGKLIRIAFSATKKTDIPKLFENIYKACKE